MDAEVWGEDAFRECKKLITFFKKAEKNPTQLCTYIGVYTNGGSAQTTCAVPVCTCAAGKVAWVLRRQRAAPSGWQAHHTTLLPVAGKKRGHQSEV